VTPFAQLLAHLMVNLFERTGHNLKSTPNLSAKYQDNEALQCSPLNISDAGCSRNALPCDWYLMD
jgi:hypothetical protein